MKKIQVIHELGLKPKDKYKPIISIKDLYNYKNEDRYIYSDSYALILDGATSLVKSKHKELDLHFFLDFCIDKFKKILDNYIKPFNELIELVLEEYKLLIPTSASNLE
ncbi:MAG: hypothetical protein ACRC4M_02340, partial [Mycoplasma sp.]